MRNEQLKEQVRNYWNKASCGTEYILKEKYSLAYYQEIEQRRYAVEPDIFSFVQFPRWHGKKVLEVGIGAGTDFLQWIRSGAQAYGIDLTEEAVYNTQKRLSLYGLQAQEVKVADAEQLPYKNNYFDLVYSWGVIHHSPDMEQCVREIIRVTKPGGTIKLMVYNKCSLFAFYRYLLCGLFKGKPFAKLDDILFHYQESPGTKAYKTKEIKQLLKKYPVTIKLLKATVTNYDLLYHKAKPFRFIAYLTACFLGWNRVGWFMTIEMDKNGFKAGSSF